MAHPPQGSSDDERVDEATAESFPASDAPSWTAMHVGVPSPRPRAPEHVREPRAALRADIDRLARARRDLGAELSGPVASSSAQDVVSQAMLDAGRAVVREPVDDSLRTWNVEAEQLGAERDAPNVVVGARCLVHDTSGAAMLLAVVRALASARMRRTVRFVVFAGESGSRCFLQRLRAEHRAIYTMISLARLDLTRARPTSRVLFVANPASAFVARAARDAFLASSRLQARALVLPSWVPGARSSDHATFWKEGVPAVMVSDAAPWRIARSPHVPDVDRMAAAVPGLAAAVVRLAGGRI